MLIQILIDPLLISNRNFQFDIVANTTPTLLSYAAEKGGEPNGDRANFI